VNPLGTIQEAVNTIASGGTINVAAGTYPENILITKPLTLLGPNSDISPNTGTRNPEAKIVPTNPWYPVVSIAANDVIFKGFEIDGTGFTATSEFAGVLVDTDSVNNDLSNVVIEKNIIHNLTTRDEALGAKRSAKGIQLRAESSLSRALHNITISDNLIDNIVSENWGAHGIQVVDDVYNVSITDNTITDIHGAVWDEGIVIDGHSSTTTTQVSIERNTIENNTIGIMTEANSVPAHITVQNNNIGNNLAQFVNNNANQIVAENNWWGDASGPDLATISGNVDYCPWLDAAYPGGNPVGPVMNTTKETAHCSIQDAIDNASAGDTIEVAAGTYNENVFITKTVELLGANSGVAYDGSRGDESIINGGVELNAPSIVLDGFKISGGGTLSGNQKAGIYIYGGTTGSRILNNILEGKGTSLGDGPGIIFGYNTTNTEIKHNEISNWYQGTYINPSNNILFEHNYYHGNFVGIGSDGLNNVILQYNIFENNLAEGWGYSDVGNVGGANLEAHYNIFKRNTVEIANYDETDLINATKNYWGHASGPSGADTGSGGKVSANVDFEPWYATETTSPTREFIEVTYNPTRAYSDSIQAAIDAASDGDTIEVQAGTYSPANTITIDKSLTILGPQAGVDPRPSQGSTRTPGSANEAIVDGSIHSLGNIFVIDADNVEINAEQKSNTV